MGIFIDELRVSVQGNVPKKFDGGTTIFKVTYEQAKQLFNAFEQAVNLFEGQDVPPAPEPLTPPQPPYAATQ